MAKVCHYKITYYKSNIREDLEKLALSEETEVVHFPSFPCHTQAVERCVKAVTESSMAVV